jgi:hypothetical protein
LKLQVTAKANLANNSQIPIYQISFLRYTHDLPCFPAKKKFNWLKAFRDLIGINSLEIYINAQKTIFM